MRITVASVLTVLLIGAVGGAFRLLLSKSRRFELRRSCLGACLVLSRIARISGNWNLGAVVARLLVVRFAPEAEGSGLQRVEATFAGEVEPAHLGSLEVWR